MRTNRDVLSKPDTEMGLEQRHHWSGSARRGVAAGAERVHPGRCTHPGALGFGAGRDFSHNDHDGHHIPLKARRRGDNSTTEITLVVPHDKMADLAHLLGLMVPTS